MAEKVAVVAEGVCRPFGHYSQAVKMGDMIYISGQLPLDPKTGKPVTGDFEDQARQVLRNMSNIMEAVGGGLGQVLKCTLYLTDLREFPKWDKVAKEIFYFAPPALTTVGISTLPGGCKICLDGQAELVKSMQDGHSMI